MLAVLLSTMAMLSGPLSQDAATRAAPQPRSESEAVDRILDRLEHRNQSLRDIRCELQFVEKDEVNLSERAKHGTVRYLAVEPNPMFLIHFDRVEADGFKLKQEWYLFDGRFLFEVVERRKHITRREIVAPGEKRDFFDLEQTPFPMPFGQKKETLLRHFDVTLAEEAPGDPPKTDHLVCVPKATSRLYRKYDRVDLYVHRTVHLPTRILVVKNNGYETQTANFPRLSNESINTGLSKADFRRPKAWSGYQEVVERLVPDASSP